MDNPLVANGGHDFGFRQRFAFGPRLEPSGTDVPVHRSPVRVQTDLNSGLDNPRKRGAVFAGSKELFPLKGGAGGKQGKELPFGVLLAQ